jgi:hypothetical protein
VDDGSDDEDRSEDRLVSVVEGEKGGLCTVPRWVLNALLCVCKALVELFGLVCIYRKSDRLVERFYGFRTVTRQTFSVIRQKFQYETYWYS